MAKAASLHKTIVPDPPEDTAREMRATTPPRWHRHDFSPTTRSSPRASAPTRTGDLVLEGQPFPRIVFSTKSGPGVPLVVYRPWSCSTGRIRTERSPAPSTPSVVSLFGLCWTADEIRDTQAVLPDKMLWRANSSALRSKLLIPLARGGRQRSEPPARHP